MTKQGKGQPRREAGDALALEVPRALAVPSLAKPSRRIVERVAAWFTTVAGVLIVAGSFMNWAVVEGDLIGPFYADGVDGDGRWTVGAGIAIVCLGGLLATKRRLVLSAVTQLIAAGAVAVAAWNWIDISRLGDNAPDVAVARPEIGIYVVLVGGVAAMAASAVYRFGH